MPGIPTIAPYPLPHAADLPLNTASWSLDPERAVLLVHDMQHYFLAPFPPSVRAPLVDNARTVREHLAGLGCPVFFTAQPGDMSEADRGLLKDFWGPGMRATPADRGIVDALAPRPGDESLTKWRYSAFFRTALLERMRELGRDQLVIVGVYAYVGILATAVEAFSQDIETFLVADAVADFTERHHRLALDYAASRCAVVTTAKGLTA
ncbi:isochorismatase family protein [Streptomyces sp. NPDC047017]|uniref:isochorismatase family protein n=1 Tax=Streptomyces sp. NPDC047017 TaxID=3155024 RepID=UPI0033C5D429